MINLRPSAWRSKKTTHKANFENVNHFRLLLTNWLPHNESSPRCFSLVHAVPQIMKNFSKILNKEKLLLLTHSLIQLANMCVLKPLGLFPCYYFFYFCTYKWFPKVFWKISFASAARNSLGRVISTWTVKAHNSMVVLSETSCKCVGLISQCEDAAWKTTLNNIWRTVENVSIYIMHALKLSHKY